MKAGGDATMSTRTGQMLLYRVARILILSTCQVLFRVRVFGRDRVPPSGPYIVAPSHRSVLDIPFAAFVTRRRIRFFAKEELFTHKGPAALFHALGAISVDRSANDRAALRAVQEALEEGEPVAIYPEGTRGSGSELGSLFDGAAYSALKLGVPIVPVGIGGSEAILAKGRVFPRLRRVAVVVGHPIRVEAQPGTVRRSEVSAVTAQLTAELQRAFADALARVA
jgi:1-acyl-sn-glycerol-3-phosphate acyltransferase